MSLFGWGKKKEKSKPSPQSKSEAVIVPSKEPTPQERYAHITDRVGVAVVGAGARLSYLLLEFLAKHGPLVQILAISDEAPEAIKSAIELLWRFPELKTVPTFRDHREAIAVPGVKWVLIGSKNYLHKQQCVDAFAAGKHVWCEKPIAISVDECEEIRKAHEASGKLFATGFVLRYAPFYNKIHELVKSGSIGRLVSIEANELLAPAHGGYIMRNWRRFRDQSGPHILEKCCHDLDLLNWIVDSVPSRVAAFGGTNIFVPENKPTEPNMDDYYEAWDIAWEKVNAFDSEKDIEDNVVAILEYRNNCRVSFHTNSNSGFPQRKITICGVKGTIQGLYFFNISADESRRPPDR
eukprot:TRINITY_DN7552_c0_g1_i4.p1 TRINITY_DN7552_c0_g1~~TRINITY_DN7552_c0_g1_i4.p1  ORF type:complete len:351 (-),score=53.40 TRINITY_DN7552_c0_g1_i4:340-1392(-)